MKKTSEIIKDLQDRLTANGDEDINFVMAVCDPSMQKEMNEKFRIFEDRICGRPLEIVDVLPDDEKEEWLVYLAELKARA